MSTILIPYVLGGTTEDRLEADLASRRKPAFGTVGFVYTVFLCGRGW
ncbi:MAG: hypothetical protein ACLSVD_17030 [Eggerthellaceae bacterium]